MRKTGKRFQQGRRLYFVTQPRKNSRPFLKMSTRPARRVGAIFLLHPKRKTNKTFNAGSVCVPW